MKVRSLGHVVIKVRDQQRAEAFYNGLLGIPIAARYPQMSATFFTLGNHHDFAVVAIGDDAEDLTCPVIIRPVAMLGFLDGGEPDERQAI